ncbi:ribulose-phosphate 3-epimerase [Paradesulfitobacterium ferrireducens]|uniref:ribulose-phosphate 3-epimerase n=1 Tax=Paradesulfitobacterium ferrireducens TaxID=2816476 RepID=UPI0038B255F5
MIAPSILSADFARLGEQVRLVEKAGAKILHIDVMDGHFVPNITFGPALLKALRPHSRMRFDVHLMIEEPERYVADFAAAGADHITVHWEASRHAHRLIQQIKGLGVTAGLALNPATPVEMLHDILEDLDMVLLMSVNPGFGGQQFIPGVLRKLEAVRRQLESSKNQACEIEVDGGIHTGTAPSVIQAGAQILVAGAAVFGAPDPARAYRELESLSEGFGGD